jgi:hypothetical protein
MSTDSGGVVWIRTASDITGTYRVVLEIDDDTSHGLTREGAQAYATAVLAAVARAEYDAAVIRQITTIADLGTAGMLVTAIRADRPPITWPTPLTLIPGVSAATRAAFLHIAIRTKVIGQWTIPDAREHAAAVLEAVEVADLDGGYLMALRSSPLSIDEIVARAMINDLAKYRVHPDDPDDARGDPDA